MTFEDRLASIDNTLKALLTIFQTSSSATVLLGEPTTAEKPASRRTKKSEPETAAATTAASAAPQEQAATTVFWLIEKHNTVYEQRAGEPAPSIEGAVQVTETEYLAKKEEFAKKINSAAAQQAPAGTAPSAPATQDAAAQSSAESVTFQQVVEKLTELSKGKNPGQGRDGVLSILTEYGVAKVPALEPLKKNAEILAKVEALLNPAAAAGADLF
jgi:hypothetical protein